jgi:hypothetical protein
MIRKIFSITCLLLLAFSVSGQDETASKLKFGVKVGTTISSFSSEQPQNTYKPGLVAGGFVSYGLTNSLSLQLEPSYMQQGGNLIFINDPLMLGIEDFPYLIEVRNQKITYHNIDIPLLLKYETTVKGLKVFGVAGPSISINAKATSDATVSARSYDMIPVYVTYDRYENISSNIENLQYGVVGGLGFETPLGNHTLIFDMKYKYGLNTTYPGYSYLGINQVKGDLSSNTFYFTLGFGF